MRLLVFGASGKAGRRLVTDALAQGHDVTAFTYLGFPGATPGRPRTLIGDFRDRELVESSLADREAVLWAPGALVPQESALSEGVRTLTSAMERRGPRRLIFLSSLNVAECHRRAALFSAILLFRLFQGGAGREADTQERYVRESTLQWTIVRAGALSDRPSQGRYRVGFGAADIPPDATISYTDAARFMLGELTDARYVRATVGLFA
jgi:putative NADH-flavin reductase